MAATATKPRTAVTSPAATAHDQQCTLAQELIDQQMKLRDACEVAFRARLCGRRLPNDHALFKGAGMDLEQIEREEGRVKSVMAHEAVAGRAKDRAASLAKVMLTRETEAIAIPKLDAEIQGLQNERRRIVDERAEAEVAHNRRMASVDALRQRNFLPEHIAEIHDRMHGVANATPEATELRNLTARVKQIDGIAALAWSRDDCAINLYVESFRINRVDNPVLGLTNARAHQNPDQHAVSSGTWDAHVTELRAERERAVERIAELEPVVRERMRPVEAVRDYYVDRIEGGGPD